MAAASGEMDIKREKLMKRGHRKSHLVIWIVMIPLLAVLVWQTLDGKRIVPTENARPLVKQSEVFK